VVSVIMTFALFILSAPALVVDLVAILLLLV